MTPAVSVVIPTRDRLGTLKRAIGSVESQSYRDFELIVIDDGSLDGTAYWVRANVPDAKLIEVAKPGGAASARNRGVAMARGSIIAFLDDDDVWSQDYLQTQVDQFEVHPGADLCTTGHLELNGAGQRFVPDVRPLYRYTDTLIHHLAESPIHTLSVAAMKSTSFERIGRFDEALSIVHDFDWFLRCIAAGGEWRHNPAALVERRIPGGLVTRHRDWFREESEVRGRIFGAGIVDRGHWERIRAARALLFARVGLAKGDLTFGFARLLEAFWAAPVDAGFMAFRRLLRYRSRRVNRSWKAEVPEAQ